MKSLRVRYRLVLAAIAVTPSVLLGLRSPDPVATLAPLVVASLVGLALAAIAIRYVERSRSRREASPAGPRPDTHLAGFWLRTVAFAGDWIGVLLVDLVLFSGLNRTLGGSAGLAAWIVFPVYFIGCWAATGQTIGMKAVGLRVVRGSDGGKLGWVGATKRFVGLMVSFMCFYVGVVWVAFEERKRGWHDMFAGTVVVQVEIAPNAEPVRV